MKNLKAKCKDIHAINITMSSYTTLPLVKIMGEAVGFGKIREFAIPLVVLSHEVSFPNPRAVVVEIVEVEIVEIELPLEIYKLLVGRVGAKHKDDVL